MDSEPRRYFLLSIRPEYSERIFSGEKKFELRKRRLGIRRGDIVLVYTSSPIQALTGAFVALDEAEIPIEDLWKRHRAVLGIDRESYSTYFQNVENAVAITIGRTIRVPAISLPDLRKIQPGFTPPQSFMYCPDRLRSQVLEEAGSELNLAAA
jgi:predicted transcriptional regulator